MNIKPIIASLFVSIFITAMPIAMAEGEKLSKIPEHELKIYEDQEIIKNLMIYRNNGSHEKVFEAIRNIKNGEQMKEALLWLRTRVMADDTYDPRYALLYAESLLRIIGKEQEDYHPLMETAAMVYLYGHLTIAVDAQRCIDRDGAWDIVSSLNDPFSSLIEFYKELPEHKRRDILTVAMRLEDRISERPPNQWICAKSPDSRGPADNIEKVETEIFSIMQEFDLQPQFVSPRIWKERRIDRRHAFARQFK